MTKAKAAGGDAGGSGGIGGTPLVATLLSRGHPASVVAQFATRGDIFLIADLPLSYLAPLPSFIHRNGTNDTAPSPRPIF